LKLNKCFFRRPTKLAPFYFTTNTVFNNLIDKKGAGCGVIVGRKEGEKTANDGRRSPEVSCD